jgi:glutathione synthase/RimK-type ligase-like ATP-grasp enzyme
VILLWGLMADAPLQAVHDELVRTGHHSVLVDQADYRSVTAAIDFEAQPTGWISTRRERLDIGALTGYYARPQLMDDPGRDVTFGRRVAVDGLLTTVAETLPDSVAVVNRPSAMASNDSKPAQTHRVRAQGFAVPDTLVTNDAEALDAFVAAHGDVVYKSTSGIRSVASQLMDEHRLRREHLTTCPTQFQEFVPGTDYRVHVIGDRVFAIRIDSSAIDYRYASRTGHTRTMTSVDLDPDVTCRCVGLAGALGLLLAGIDLRQTPDGEWYCFEANTSPAFTWFEEHTGQPLTAAVADILAHGPSR